MSRLKTRYIDYFMDISASISPIQEISNSHGKIIFLFFNKIIIINVLKEEGYTFNFNLLESKILKEFQYDCPLYNSDNNGQFSMF